MLFMLALARGTADAARALRTASNRTDLRSGPSKQYNRVTVLPRGIKLWAITKRGAWYRVRLSKLLESWVSEGQVEPLSRDVPPPAGRVTDLFIQGADEGSQATIYLSAPVPFRVRQLLDPPELKLDLFSTSLARYGVRQFPSDLCTSSVVARQIADDWAELTFRLNFHQQRGWRVSFTDAGHMLFLIRSPYQRQGLEGKLIILDPGHGGWDSGAVGPTGLREKEANLIIAEGLYRMLLTRGAQVKMLRDRDQSVGTAHRDKRGELEARLAASEHLDADLFLSIHNNAVGSGNPNRAFGTETYYWTPMSILPARILQSHLCGALGTRNRFVSWRPFYVLRHADVPRVLVECAFVSNPAEEKKLRSDDFLQAAAYALLTGLEEFFERAGNGR